MSSSVSRRALIGGAGSTRLTVDLQGYIPQTV